ncbi:DUF4272 domain-containing protein [Sphingomonas sp.]|uniref:DUF4272 domain-containing protein n=1 Tax=Sphingomonas sp. TaxID=28214 RepID=UPI003B3BC0F2
MSLLKRLFGTAASDAPAAEPVTDPLRINVYATVRTLPPIDFRHELLGWRDLSDPDLPDHLRGLTGYVMSRGDGEMTALRYHVWRHAQRVRNHVSLDVLPEDLDGLQRWARTANGILFLPDGSVRAPDLAILFDAEGASDPTAALPYQPDAIARRQRTLQLLEGLELQPPTSIPPAIGEAELELRSPDEVLRRALALLYIAARGQMQGTEVGPIPLGRRDENPIGFAALTERERALLDGAGAEEGAFAAISWRYEAANALLWALGFEGASLADSESLIDVDALWRSVAEVARAGAPGAGLAFRPAAEILDALDRTWLEHWIVRQAHAKDLAIERPNGDVVMERHVALNWLTSFQNEFGTSWDEIDTPT